MGQLYINGMLLLTDSLIRRLAGLIVAVFALSLSATAAGAGPGNFPLPLEAYGDVGQRGLSEVLQKRIAQEPFNLIATIIFCLAIIHTFMGAKFRHWAHAVEKEHAKRLASRGSKRAGTVEEISFQGQILHYFGEVEVVFGLWAVVLAVALTWSKGWPTILDYLEQKVSFTEPMFVVVIMAMASTRPILRFAEQCLRAFATIGRGTVAAWWLSILIVAPILGSFITEPAAMVIAALLIGRMFYHYKPSPRLAYATIGLLFVNISVGGTFTHFAAPPVLMVAAPWGWDLPYMFVHFGLKAGLGILIATLLHYTVFRKEFAALETVRAKSPPEQTTETNDEPVPVWITLVQLGFMAWTVFVAHHPVLFIGGFLFFLGFTQATAHHQSRLDLKPSLLVGFFLAGLVIHGGLQGWWIEPVISRLSEVPLFAGAVILTAFNDNAAVTYLATLVPGFSASLQYAVVAGAVAGGGLTVIANAPNPAGQSILQRYFPDGVSPLGLLLGAACPTVIMAICFLLLRNF